MLTLNLRQSRLLCEQNCTTKSDHFTIIKQVNKRWENSGTLFQRPTYPITLCPQRKTLTSSQRCTWKGMISCWKLLPHKEKKYIILKSHKEISSDKCGMRFWPFLFSLFPQRTALGNFFDKFESFLQKTINPLCTYPLNTYTDGRYWIRFWYIVLDGITTTTPIKEVLRDHPYLASA